MFSFYLYSLFFSSSASIFINIEINLQRANTKSYIYYIYYLNSFQMPTLQSYLFFFNIFLAFRSYETLQQCDALALVTALWRQVNSFAFNSFLVCNAHIKSCLSVNTIYNHWCHQSSRVKCYIFIFKQANRKCSNKKSEQK